MKRLKRLNTKLIKDKFARCELAPNLIPLDEIEDCISLKGRDELLDPNKYEKVSGSEYADDYAYGAAIKNGEFQCCLIEYHEYKCIDENDPNFGKSVTIIAGCPMNEITHEIENGFTDIEIFNGTSSEVKNSNQIIRYKYRVFESSPSSDGDYNDCKKDVEKRIKEDKIKPEDALFMP